MNLSSMFDGRTLRFTPMIAEQDAPAVASWTNNLTVARKLRNEAPVRPLSVFETRKVLDKWLADAEKSTMNPLFGLRAYGDEHLVGFLRISGVMWVHGAGMFDLVIGSADDWVLYAGEALQMGLRYAFDEMNLFRVTVPVDELDDMSLSLYTAANFYLEVRQRQALFENGRYFDRLMFGMLRPEWAAFAGVAEAAL